MSAVVIIDYGSGNLRSAAKAFERAANESGTGHEIKVTDQPEDVRKAERVVLPGVGAFGDCMRGLEAVPGMVEALNETVADGGRPFLGICVGMQLMADKGLEHGETPGLGWLAGTVEAITPSDPSLKIPHMGWNELQLSAHGMVHPVFQHLGKDAHAYFVHSYAFEPAQEDTILASVEYGGPVVAAVGRDNLVGTQFHPEKSQRTGLRLIANFLQWQP